MRLHSKCFAEERGLDFLVSPLNVSSGKYFPIVNIHNFTDFADFLMTSNQVYRLKELEM